MDNPLKIRVGIPSYSGKLFPETYETVKALSSYEGSVLFDVYIVPQCYSSSEGRNIALSMGNQKIKQVHDFDYYLSMDADNFFTIADILMLLDQNKDIISAAYVMRSSRLNRGTNRFVAAYWKNNTPGIVGTEDYILNQTTGLLKVDTVGLGCCLISRRVFDAMPFPYFRNEVINYEIDGEPHAALIPDDLSFSVNCAKYGFSQYVDCDIIIGHACGNEER